MPWSYDKVGDKWCGIFGMGIVFTTQWGFSEGRKAVCENYQPGTRYYERFIACRHTPARFCLLKKRVIYFAMGGDAVMAVHRVYGMFCGAYVQERPSALKKESE